jgi:hypothetical protein
MIQPLLHASMVPLQLEVTDLSRKQNKEDMEKGKMTVSEAGRLGGARGGPRVRELIREGKEHEQE